MRISTEVLRGYIGGLPASVRDVRMLLDDIGIEVKRIDDEASGRLTLELLANRGDHRCYLGIAREIAGRIGGSARMPGLQAGVWKPAQGVAPWPDTGLQVRIEVEEGLAYAGVPLRVIPGGDIAPEAAAILEAAGLKRVHPVVDVTNAVNLELGQPLHAFDAAKVRGAIRVRKSTEGERAWPLFAAEPVALPAGLLVIADDEKVLAVAGVIGCEDSKVDDQTVDIILESACFDPVLVHKASRRLGIHSDASARFERGADPEMVWTGVERALYLLRGAAEQRGAAAVSFNWDGQQACIPLSLAALGRWYGLGLSVPEVRAQVERRLEPMGFEIEEPEEGGGESVSVRVPTWRRWDVRNPEDLYEEFGRASSYDALPAALPPVGLGAVLTPAERLRERIEAVLVGAGFYEVITDGFYGRGDLEALELPADHALRLHVETMNSLDRGYSLLKNTGFVQALAGFVESQNLQIAEHRVFEFTRTFHPDPAAPNGACRERPILWALSSGPERSVDWAHRPAASDIFQMKGLVQEFAVEAGVDLSLRPGVDGPLRDVLHPHRQLSIRYPDGAGGQREVGAIGEIHPRLLRGRRGRPIYLELETEALSPAPSRATDIRANEMSSDINEGRKIGSDGIEVSMGGRRRQPLPPIEQRFHSIRSELPPLRPWSERNLAFTLPLGLPSSDLLDTILGFSGAIHPEQAAITDLYAHEQDGQPVRTLTVLLRYRNDDAALSVEVINGATEQIAAHVAEILGGRGVRRRV